VRAQASSGGTVSLVVPESRSGAGVDDFEPYFPTPETERGPKRPAPVESGTAYESRCKDRSCGFRWRLPGLWARRPTKVRCPVCHGYDLSTKPVFKVRPSGGVVLLLVLAAALTGCRPTKQPALYDAARVAPPSRSC